MNKKIIIIVAIIVTIAIGSTIVSFSPTENEIDSNENSRFAPTDKIDSMLQKIEDDRIVNQEGENPYQPKEREWISSGPFKLDRSEYVLGERLFVNLDYLDKNTKKETLTEEIE